MAHDLAAVEGPDLEDVLDALDDADARAIIRALDEPMTASQLSDECDIPLSTMYRKLDLLTDADLLSEGTQIRADGHHATTYEIAFESVVVELAKDRKLVVDIEYRSRTPDERLADLWNEVRRET